LPGSLTVPVDRPVAVAGPVAVELGLDLALAGALTMDVAAAWPWPAL
jgi:hypothetical protein